MGSPSTYDVKFAELLGTEIRKMLEDGRNGEMPVPLQVTGIARLNHCAVSRIPLSRIGQLFFPTAASSMI